MQKECLLNVCRGKHIFITPLEEETLNVQEEDGHSNSLISEGAMTQFLKWQKNKVKFQGPSWNYQ